MSTPSRNTRELKCDALKISRKIEVADGVDLYIGCIAAINPDGELIPAADSATAQIIVGRVEDITEDAEGVLYGHVCSGVYGYANGASGEALTIADLNKIVFVVDAATVGKVGGTNKVIAGVLRDVAANGTVWVELGNLPLSVIPHTHA